METYTYLNIFETKGLEYILLILFMVMFVVLFRYTKPVDKDQTED